METIISSLRNYFRTCPLLKDGKINVDFLPEGTKSSKNEYSIDPIPAEKEIKSYLDGSAICQYAFVIRAISDWSGNVIQNINNSGFFEQLSDWVDEQCLKNNLPNLSKKLKTKSIKVLSQGYIQSTVAGYANYQVQCCLIYYKEGDY